MPLAPVAFRDGQWECYWPQDPEDIYDDDVTGWKATQELVRMDSFQKKLMVYHDPDTPTLGFISMQEANK